MNLGSPSLPRALPLGCPSDRLPVKMTPTRALVLLTCCVLSSLAGCETLRLAPGPSAAAVAQDPARNLALMRAPSTDVLSVAAWGLALVIAALVIAFMARLLNHRRLIPSNAPSKKEK